MFVRFIFISVIFFYSFSTCLFAQNKIKLGLLVPLTGEFSEIGQSIVKSTLLAINKIDNPLIEIIPKENIKINYQKLDKTLKMSFFHRRKTLKNNLSKFDSNIEQKIIDSGLNPKSRPQEISPKQYVQLSENLF